ncbi:helix-turn-helix domain-containing protein [Nocardioides sp. CFH 31398]|uniref:sigma-54-dependent Fis family transcriptional regulator n=1 Tax=Nocardioides sp. CFH 31398 TaxID=2919579 RepID=UPI001F06A38C|nr:helix-turn-helix domain-containing protein [Nocardioides sp. CFH 31398]MCH1865478.1 hypothetical protein [Nocardioides sp. CFH 31398]
MTTTPELRPPIAASWHRAQIAGLEPDSALEGIDYDDVELTGSLLSAAGPVLDDLTERLAHTGYATVLVDRDGRVVHRASGQRAVLRALDELGIGVGASLQEERVGTNAPGTVVETRSSIVVRGDEHFARQLRGYSCYAHPIFHPTTRRILGALDLTARVDEANPLLPPLVERAVADIEARLLEAGSASQARLLAAFRRASVRRGAVVAVGRDVTMSNQAALDLLESADVALLQAVARDAGSTHCAGGCHEVELTSGLRVHVRTTPVDGDSALLDVEPAASSRRVTTDRVVPRPAGTTTVAPRLVCGPPGSGRTTEALRLAREQAGPTAPVAVLTATSALLDGPSAWARHHESVVRTGVGALVVDGLEQLDDPLLELVGAHAASGRAPAVVLVSAPHDELTGRAAVLAATCLEVVVVPPLAQRAGELGSLVAAMLRDLGADPSLHLVPSALRALATHPWPGNLAELRAVVAHVAARRHAGGATVDDLPEAYRAPAPSRPLTPLARAERDAIAAALREHGGNKLRAARSLGISRTTLYAKLRALGIAAD